MGEEDLQLVWVDTHAHLFDEAFREDFDATLMRARGRGVHRIVLPNIDGESLPLLFSLYQDYPDVFRCAVGLHPTSVNADWLESLNRLKVSLDREGVVAIGEVGLDLYWDTSSFAEQQNALRVQMEWALERDLALLVHARNAIDEVLSLIEAPRMRSLRVVLHAFNGSEEQYRRAMARGNTWIGLGGIATYRNGFSPRLIAAIDFARAVMETDCPYLAPSPHRGKRNEPAFLVDTAAHLAASRGIPLEAISTLTTQAAADLFQW